MRPLDAIVHMKYFLATDDHTLPYDVLDALRVLHSLDLTGCNLKLARRVSMYRSYVLMRAG